MQPANLFTLPRLFQMRTLRLFLLLCCVSLVGCAEKSDVTILKMAHALPTDHPVHKAMVFFADRAASLSDGKVRIDIYPGGQLGPERELMELLQIGSLAMTKVSSSPMESFVPEMKLFSMPYVFRDSAHYWHVLDSEIGQNLLLAGESVRLRGLGYYDAGARSFYTSDVPVRTPEDLSGLKIRVQNSQTSIKMVNALGGSGTPVSFGELYTALDQGVVDGAENNPPSLHTSRHYEVSGYYSLNEHTYVPDIVLISSYIWSTLSPDEQSWVQQAMNESIVYQRKLWQAATDEALRVIQEAGVEVIEVDKSLFSEKVAPMYEELKGQPLYDLIQKVKQMGVGDEVAE